MPLILFLDQHLGIVRAGVKKTASLGDVMERAAAVLTRRRGAFLTTWFGPGVPMHGVDLSVSVVNAGPILSRIGAVRQMQSAQASAVAGPSFVEPLAGIVGTFVGGFVGIFLGGIALLALLFVEGGPALPIGVVLAVMLVVDSVLAVLSGLRILQQYRTGMGGGRSDGSPSSATSPLGSAVSMFAQGRAGAAMAGTAIRTGREVLGPREQVRDPLTRAVLTLADRLAGMVTRMLGAAATFLQMIPVVAVLREAAGPLRALGAHLVEIVTVAVTSVFDAITTALRRSGIVVLPLTLRRAMPRLIERIRSEVAAGIEVMTTPFRTFRTEAERQLDEFSTLIAPYSSEHPVVMFLKGLRGLPAAFAGFGSRLRTAGSRLGERLMPDSVRLVITAVRSLLSRLPSTGGSSSPSGPGMGDEIASWASRTAGVDRAVRSGHGVSAAVGHLQDAAGFGSVGATATLAPTVVEGARDDLASGPMFVVGSVPRVFQAERARVVRRGERLLHDETFRSATRLLDGAAMLAGPEIDAHVRELTDRLDAIEAPLRERLGSMPVREIPPPRYLVPHLRRLRVTGSPGDDEARLRDWSSLIVSELRRTPVAPPVLAGGVR